MPEKERKLCVICGLNDATTVDHVPPKGIFPRPRPSNLITVPACEECNSGASILDETFRLYLALHVGDLDGPLTAAYFREALRTYRHNKRLQREIMKTVEPIDYKSSGGIYLGQGAKIIWNSNAHNSTIERTVRGLYYHHYGEILGTDVPIATQWFSQPNQKFINISEGFQKNTIGESQFSYLYGRAEEKPSASVWYFEFYERHWAGAHTGLKNET